MEATNGITFSLESVTPDLARKWLEESNTNNRQLRRHHVTSLSRQMKSGKWLQNGDAIRFSKDGRLLDGQHRLAAIAEAGESLDMFVARGIDEATFSTIDTGKRRNGATALEIGGYKNANILSSAVATVYGYQEHQTYRLLSQQIRLSPGEILEYLQEYPGIEQSASYANRHRDGLFPRSLAGAIHFITTGISPREANLFWAGFFSGIGLEPGSPILTLRNRLMKAKMSREQRISRPDKCNMVAKAWNAFRAKKDLRRLVVKEGEFVELL